MTIQLAHTIQADHLIWTDTDNLIAIVEAIPPQHWQLLDLNPKEVTGALVTVGDGEYSAVWVTDSTRPYNVNAIYKQLI